MKKVIKVKLIGKLSTRALIESGFDSVNGKSVCFHAYSDTMKARVLDYMVANPPFEIDLSFTDESPRDGEWLE